MADYTVEETRSLRNSTEEYWRRLNRATEGDRPSIWGHYVQDLLPLEMRGKVAQIECDVLVCLVGHSIEPILQSTWVYKPTHVLLLVSDWYSPTLSGEALAGQIKQVLGYLPQDRALLKHSVAHRTVEATPASVFQTLVSDVDKSRHVVIDITGAKKSMVAGAFLYAAYADVPVSYVDFAGTDYNATSGRPYGYATDIRIFENPYTAFALRSWEHVQQLYRTYRFREALRLLQEDIKPAMRQSGLTSAEGADPVSMSMDSLGMVLHCYELWDAGDLNGAHQLTSIIAQRHADFTPPSVVDRLHLIWPKVHQGPPETTVKNLRDEQSNLSTGSGRCKDSFYCRDNPLLTYADDELARISRLIDYSEDYRSAFLRAASLNEVLLKARLAKLRCHNKLKATDLGLVAFRYLVERATAEPMLRVLQGERTEHLWCRMDDSVAPLKPFWEGCPLTLDTLIDLRNSTVHTYLAIPRTVAEAAVDLAGKNLQDFRQFWHAGGDVETVVEVIPWSDLCRLCGVDKFLTPNLLD